MSKPSDAALQAAGQISLWLINCGGRYLVAELAQAIDTAADQKYARLKQTAQETLVRHGIGGTAELQALRQALQELEG